MLLRLILLGVPTLIVRAAGAGQQFSGRWANPAGDVFTIKEGIVSTHGHHFAALSDCRASGCTLTLDEDASTYPFTSRDRRKLRFSDGDVWTLQAPPKHAASKPPRKPTPLQFASSSEPRALSSAPVARLQCQAGGVRKPSPRALAELALSFVLPVVMLLLAREGRRSLFTLEDDGEHWDGKTSDEQHAAGMVGSVAERELQEEIRQLERRLQAKKKQTSNGGNQDSITGEIILAEDSMRRRTTETMEPALTVSKDRKSSMSGQQSSRRRSTRSSEVLPPPQDGRKWLFRFVGDSEIAILDEPRDGAMPIANNWWRYTPQNGNPKKIRKEPKIHCDPAEPQRVMHKGELFQVDNEIEREGVRFLHLLSGAGWVYEKNTKSERMCQRAMSITKGEAFKVSEVRRNWLKLADGRGWLSISDPDRKLFERGHEVHPLLAVFGPVGSKKRDLIGRLQRMFPEKLEVCRSHTTRQAWTSESPKMYNFGTDFDVHEFLEEVEVDGARYGTSVAAVEAVQQSGKICVLNINALGCEQLTRNPPIEGVKSIFMDHRDRNSEDDLKVGAAADFRADSSSLETAAQDLALAEKMRGWYPSLSTG